MHMPHALLRMLVAWDLNDLLLYNMLLFDIDLQIFSCDGGCSCCPFSDLSAATERPLRCIAAL